MAVGNVSLRQLLSLPYVMGSFNLTSTAPAALQQFYRMRPNDPYTASGGIARTWAYDLIESTLTMADGRAPDLGPSRIPAKIVGQAFATCMRFYESIPFSYANVYGLRGLGTMALDARGKSFVARNLLYLAERQINACEFMVSRMFRGDGFSILQQGERWRLREKDGGTVNVNYNVPSDHTGNLGGIIDALWSAAGTKIIQQLLAINAQAERETGLPIRHIWINSVTYSYLLANTQLQTVRGTAQIIFDQFGLTRIEAASGPDRPHGFTVVFPAMPQFLFHVYDGVSIVSADVDPSPATGRTTGNTTKYIPDGRAIMTPEVDPGGWHGTGTTGEYIRPEGPHSEAVLKEGLDAWSYPIDDPAGEELRSLNNYVPLLINPKAIYYPTIA